MLRGRSRNCILHRPDKLLPQDQKLSHLGLFLRTSILPTSICSEEER